MTRAWRRYLLASGVVLAGFLLVPNGVPRDTVYLAVGVTCVVAILVGVRHNRPATPWAWWLMAAGMALWVAGDAVYSWYEDIAHVAPFPSAADYLYLAAYPLLGGGLSRLAWQRRHGRDLAASVDAAIVTLACGLVSWVVLAGPVARSGTTGAERFFGVAYPATDIVLLAALTWLLTSVGHRSTSFRLLAGAAGVLVVSDSLFLLAQAGAFADPLGALDLGWLSAYALWGAAALHPGMSRLSEAPDVAASSFTRRRLLALGVAVLVPPATHAVQLLTSDTPDGWAFVVVSTVMFTLVVLRMGLAIREVRRSETVRSRLAADLAHQAAHDSLTSLTNRPRVLELLEAALHRAQRNGGLVGLLFIDLDDFKRVNDTYGHAAGDHVLRVTAARMREAVRAGDTIGRLGGDEFVVVLEQVPAETDVVQLADRLVTVLRQPVRLPSVAREVSVGASVGVALSRDGGTDAIVLLHDADAAAYRAKRAGRGRFEIFDEALRREMHDRAALETAIETGLDEGQFLLHYQPVFDVATGAATGYEALLRWARPGHGIVAPADFIPLAEQSALVCRLGRWVLLEATQQLVAWTTQDPEAFGGVSMAVNVSGRHLYDDSLVRDVTDALLASGLAPERLVLEMTETILVDGHAAAGRLQALRRLGVRISIDDFGTGYTSIGQLQSLHADGLKIDRSLVESTTPGSRELVRLLVHAAHAFGLEVVAEGVEHESQLEPLRAAGCDRVQGFLLARPQPAQAFQPRTTPG
ncbi:bifunctional diguanylate cyclase/phosphodiesterase [Kineosporia sp. R_H_3]|uniref:putative bifunctional diguanylate cyclase/phosphodiesterase n=1 Tax=Kineosporia sp. R_H_3 TaxID=1961848 RepID=UPI000B4B20A1|nr:EAL domain-containing protein [Kineosporia sp. R_H_3]